MHLKTAQYPDCLIVLDTLGIRSSAAILGIAAVRFDIDKPCVLPQQLHLAIDPDSNSLAGRTFESNAMQWWADRPDISEVFGRTGQTLNTALEQLHDFWGDSENLWTTAGGYEVAIMCDAFSHYGIRTPWPYWSVNCGRTILNVAAWLNAYQAEPSVYGKNLQETALKRLHAIRAAYDRLKQRKAANGTN